MNTIEHILTTFGLGNGLVFHSTYQLAAWYHKIFGDFLIVKVEQENNIFKVTLTTEAKIDSIIIILETEEKDQYGILCHLVKNFNANHVKC